MKCRSALVVLALCGVVALAWTAGASAYTGSPILQNPGGWQSTLQDIQNLPSTPPAVAPYLNPSTGAAVTSTEIAGGMAEAEATAGVFPTMMAFASNVIPVTAAASLGVVVGLAAGNFIYKKWVADHYVAGGVSEGWATSQCATGSLPGGRSCGSTGTTYTGFNNNVQLCGASATVTATYGACRVWGFGSSLGVQAFLNTCVTTECAQAAAAPGIKLFNTGTTGSVCWNGTSAVSTAVVGACFMVIATERVLEQNGHFDTTNSTGYAATTNQFDGTAYQNYSPTSQDATNAANRLCVNGAYSSCDASENGARIAIEHQLDPTYDPSTSSGTIATSPAATVIVLPRPALNESVQEWMDRLNALGYLGAATITYLGAADTTLGTAAPAEITYGATTIDLRTGHAGWPSTNPTISPTASLTIVANPVSAPQLAPAPCASCAIDWSPITSISYGTKFPFGGLTWLQSGMSALAPSGTCPDLVLTDPFGGPDYHVSFCNVQWATVYRPWVFPFIEALMTLMAVAFFVAKLLGSRATDG